ncbi:MAG: DNA polymerase IV [Methanomethylovorans sp.]|jgi:DNA polymerase IV (DinB-like DNA polymerase)|nr:DNA polymerase IV [Methanomethylovorans sp.]
MDRVIIHVDMDYFYAAIEEREDPSLKDKAVVVCMYSNRGEESGAVSTSNYIARKAGIRSAMPCKQAKALKPDAVFLPVRREFYEEVSARVMDILRSHADSEDSFEKISIDEAFLEISENCGGDFEKAEKIGLQIKHDVIEHEKLTCSVGIGPNKLIAKMASSFRKPDGMTIVKPEDVRNFLNPMPVKKLWGIGKVTEEKLQQMGIETLGQLAVYDTQELIAQFGKNRGIWLKKASSGIDESPVTERSSADQIGRMASLKEDTRDDEMILALLKELVDDVMKKVDLRRISFRSVTVTVIFSNFRMVTKSRTLNHPVSDRSILQETAREMMLQLLHESSMNCRRIGVRVGNLQQNIGQKSLFEYFER